MTLRAKVADKLMNPARVLDPDQLRDAVQGKTVLVTGASFGLGEATARQLGAAAANVVLVARTADKLHDVAHSINAGGGRAVAYAADLADPAAVHELTAKIAAEHAAVDIVVSNAGKSIRRSLALQYDRPHDFQRTIDVNYLGPIRLLLGLLPAMRAAGRGHIINVSTIGVRVPPTPRWGAYVASKGAFDTWLRSVTPELHADGIAVSSLYMTLIYTRMSAPTPIMRKLPGLYPDQAAGIVAKAIIERPRMLAPWWAGLVELTGNLFPGPLNAAIRLAYRHSTDSASARGVIE